MKNLNLIWTIIALLFATSCHARHDILIPETFDDIVPIKNWQMVGPFSFDTLKQLPQNTFENRDLDAFNLNEDSMNDGDFDILKGTKYSPFSSTNNDYKLHFFDYVKKDTAIKSNIYICSSFTSATEREVVFVTDGSYSYKLWINKKQVTYVTKKENNSKVGNRFVKVKLNKGKNFIFAKIGRGSNQNSWELIFGICSVEKGKEVYRKNYYSDFIHNSLIHDSLEVYLGIYTCGSLNIANTDGKKILEKQFVPSEVSNYSIKLRGLKDIANGFYQCKLMLEKDTLSEIFYKGDYLQLANSLKQSKNKKFSRRIKKDIVAGINRINFLSTTIIDKSEFSPTGNWWIKNQIFWAYSVYKFINDYEKNLDNQKNIYGTYIKTYVAKDDSANYFFFHLGDIAAKKEKKPLILIVPYELGDAPFEQNGYLGNLDQIEMDSKIADEYGFAVLWLFMRGSGYTPQIGLNDAVESIARIQADYNIDTNNIYLLGDCVGGGRSFLVAQKKPDIFAGLAVIAPVTMNGTGNDVPFNFVSNLYNIPLYIQHGESDKNSPIKNTEIFISEAVKYGYQPVFNRQKGSHVQFCKDYRRLAFQFLDSLKNRNNKNIHKIPTVVKYSTFDTINNSAYWIKIYKTNSPIKAEIVAVYDSLTHKFDITCANLQSYIIFLNKLKISKMQITIFTNGKLSFKGMPNSKEIRIKV